MDDEDEDEDEEQEIDMEDTTINYSDLKDGLLNIWDPSFHPTIFLLKLVYGK